MEVLVLSVGTVACKSSWKKGSARLSDTGSLRRSRYAIAENNTPSMAVGPYHQGVLEEEDETLVLSVMEICENESW